MIACCVLCCKMLRFSLTNVTVCIMCDSRSKTWSITWTSASTRLLSWRLSRCRNISRQSSRSWCRLVTRCSLWRKTLEMWVKRRWIPPRFHRPFSISIGKKRVPPQFRSCLFQKRNVGDIWRWLQFLKVHPVIYTTARKHTHTKLFNGPLSVTIRVSQYQKKSSPTHTQEEEEGLVQRTRSIEWELIPYIVLWARDGS